MGTALSEEAEQLEEALSEQQNPAALGSPHDGYAAVLMTLMLGLIYFGFGMARWLQAEENSFWWMALVGLGLLIAPALLTMKYFRRAHGMKKGGGFPALPAFAMYFGFMALVMFVLPILASGWADYVQFWWGYGFSCLVLATLTMAPVQVILSKDPNRHSELTA